MAYQGQFTGDVQLPITSAILKTNSVGKILAAVAGVDYLTSGDLSGYLPLTGGTLTGPLGGTSASFSSTITATDFRYTNNGYLTYDVDATGTNTMQIRSGYAGAVLSFTGLGAATFSSSVTSSNSVGTYFNAVNTAGGYAKLEISSNATSNATLSFTNQLALTGGNVLIGTTTDAGYKLDVNGTGRFSGALTATSITTSAYSYLYGLRISGNDTGNTIYQATGSLGISTGASSITFNPSLTTALTLASTGAATFSSSVTATSFIKTSGTSSQFLKADGSIDSTSYGTGTVTSVAALTLGTTGTDVSSTVATGTTTPVITLNIPDASATARGLITTSTQTFAGVKTFEGSSLNVGTIYNYSTLNILASSTPALTITDGYNGKFTFIPYENTTNGHLIRSINYADNAYYPITLAASRVQTPNGSLVVGGTNDNGYAFYTNGAGKFTGDLTANTLKTSAPTGSTAQTWKLGDVSSGTCVPANFGDFSAWFTGNVITIEINGSTYTIPVVVSNYC